MAQSIAIKMRCVWQSLGFATRATLQALKAMIPAENVHAMVAKWAPYVQEQANDIIPSLLKIRPIQSFQSIQSNTFISYGEPLPFENLPLGPLGPLAPPPPPPPPSPPAPPAPLPVLNRLLRQTQMDTVREQVQVMAIGAIEDNQDQDKDGAGR
ncbi:MAG: hypothetical protein J3R72DRAFT_473692 [Linnemannia gamsii]|nr:MAG: hypothetical protein J3R72DRAFT_473692 [Linnemannia gamsii]